MNLTLKKSLNVILLVLLAYALHVFISIPQPYGPVALGVIALTFSFNLLKSKYISIPLFVLGIIGATYILVEAYSFINFSSKQQDKFDIPTAVHFEQGDFNDALTKSASLNKPIFIDFNTTWCVPCLSFTKQVLTDKEVGEYMNQAFINLKFDAEKGEGKKLSKKYNIQGYPTLLIIDSNGKLIEEIGGDTNIVPRKDDMIEVSKKYIDM